MRGDKLHPLRATRTGIVALAAGVIPAASAAVLLPRGRERTQRDRSGKGVPRAPMISQRHLAAGSLLTVERLLATEGPTSRPPRSIE